MHRDGKIYYLCFERGVPQGDIQVVGETDRTGTSARFWPDAAIFETTTFSYNMLVPRMRQSAYLTPGVTFTIIDEREGVGV